MPEKELKTCSHTLQTIFLSAGSKQKLPNHNDTAALFSLPAPPQPLPDMTTLGERTSEARTQRDPRENQT